MRPAESNCAYIVNDAVSRPRLLDLFCGAGGAAVGYDRAGFDVTGVDLAAQPRYPFPFIRGDALDAAVWAGCFDAVHASPPCQAHSTLRARWPDRDWPDHVAATRALLAVTGVPYVLENVPGAPLDHPVTLCGSMFGLDVRRHRLFECSFPILVPPCTHGYQAVGKYSIQEHGRRILSPVARVYGDGGGKGGDGWAAAMGIDWMTRAELAQAIPPAYTEYVGGFLLAAVTAGAWPAHPPVRGPGTALE